MLCLVLGYEPVCSGPVGDFGGDPVSAGVGVFDDVVVAAGQAAEHVEAVVTGGVAGPGPVPCTVGLCCGGGCVWDQRCYGGYCWTVCGGGIVWKCCDFKKNGVACMYCDRRFPLLTLCITPTTK